MNFNNPNSIVKDLTFNKKASTKIMKGVNKLARAVSSTLGASGKCVIYEDTMGQPVITKRQPSLLILYYKAIMSTKGGKL